MSDIKDRMALRALGDHEDILFQVGWIKCLEAQRRKAGQPDTFTVTDWAEMQEALQLHRHTRAKTEDLRREDAA